MSAAASEETTSGHNNNIITTTTTTTARRDIEIRVAVLGNVDSGKSTLVGTLVAGELDNGRGSARSKVFIHNHEQQRGQTSSISQQILGFDEHNKPIHQVVAASAGSMQKNKGWKDVVTRSSKVVTFIDLAGHEKYLKTTVSGLCGCFPDYAFIIVNSLAGISKMTKEHLGISISLGLPIICIVTKIDMVPENVMERTKTILFKALKSDAAGRKMPINVTQSSDMDEFISTSSSRIVPIIYVSSVTGTGLEHLYYLLARLSSARDWVKAQRDPVEFVCDDSFHVTGVGTVISGTVQQGKITPNQTMLLGPFLTGDNTPWKEVIIRSIQYKRLPVNEVLAGSSCALSLRALKQKDADALAKGNIRRGMVMIEPGKAPPPTRMFEAEVMILHHPTTIKLGYQAVLHIGAVRQTATLVKIPKECLRTGDRVTVTFHFNQREECIKIGTALIFREGNTKGVGRITKTQFEDSEYEQASPYIEDKFSPWFRKGNSVPIIPNNQPKTKH